MMLVMAPRFCPLSFKAGTWAPEGHKDLPRAPSVPRWCYVQSRPPGLWGHTVLHHLLVAGCQARPWVCLLIAFLGSWRVHSTGGEGLLLCYEACGRSPPLQTVGSLVTRDKSSRSPASSSQCWQSSTDTPTPYREMTTSPLQQLSLWSSGLEGEGCTHTMRVRQGSQNIPVSTASPDTQRLEAWGVQTVPGSASWWLAQ